VAEVLDAETLALDDGIVVRLVNMISPRRPLWLADEVAWDAAQLAHHALEGLARGRAVTWSFGGAREDRHGRLLAHVHVVPDDPAAAPVWVQRRMIALGHARAAATRDNRACVTDLLAVEADARARRLGLWRRNHYRVRAGDSPDEIIVLANHFHLVEGRVTAHTERGRRLYINFGDDWREDFTIMIAARDFDLFTDVGIDLAALEGKRLRVRGFVESYYGPMIEVTAPEQIELVGAPLGD